LFHIILEEETTWSTRYMTTEKPKSSRMVQVTLSSGEAFAERLVMCRCQDRLLCLHKRVAIEPLERAMSP
jgi:hypothetical protein